MASLLDATSPIIRAEFLRLEAKRRERELNELGCLRKAYDFIAENWLAELGTLDETTLKQTIPEVVVEGAVEYGWVQYPRQQYELRTRVVRDAWIPGSKVVEPVQVPIADASLVEQFGRFRVEAGFGKRFLGILAGRIAHWKSIILTREAGESSRPSGKAGGTAAQQERSRQPRNEISSDSGIGRLNTSTKWEEIEIGFLSDHRVQIRMKNRSTQTLNYAEMGFEDKRKSVPNRAWTMLRLLAESNGIICSPAQAGEPWPKVEKRMQEIRKVLRKHFGISEDPLPFVAGSGYKARFRILCSASYNN